MSRFYKASGWFLWIPHMTEGINTYRNPSLTLSPPTRERGFRNTTWREEGMTLTSEVKGTGPTPAWRAGERRGWLAALREEAKESLGFAWDWWAVPGFVRQKTCACPPWV